MGGKPCLPTKVTKTAHYSKSLLKGEKKISTEKVDHILCKMLWFPWQLMVLSALHNSEVSSEDGAGKGRKVCVDF